MTKRERFLRALKNEKVDELVWAPNFDYWLQVNRAEGTLPEKYRNLAVRVSGFSQKFNLLDKKIQDHIIARTKHKAVLQVGQAEKQGGALAGLHVFKSCIIQCLAAGGRMADVF